MAKEYLIKMGRKTVLPFKDEDINNIMVFCKKKRDEAERLGHEVDRKIWDRNYLICVLGINLAFRITDILHLKVENFKGGYIHIRERKTHKEQSFPLHQSLIKIVQDYINRNNLVEGEYLMQSRQGKNKPLSRQRVDQIIEDMSKELNIGYPTGAHSLRKYFARKFYEETGDIIGLKEMLNHSTERVTLAYICYNQEIKEERRKNFFIGG